MAHEKIKPEFIFDEKKVAQLKQIVPECFEDGKLNFETLRQNLGDWAQNEEDEQFEHFGLFWPGKKDARKIATIPPEGTLEPVYGEGLKKDGTRDTDGKNNSNNVFIEGENLEVLKLLQKSYANKIKMIYIDPPYNTGNDFVYDDNFTEPLQEYLRRTGQIDEEGKPLTTNKKSDGRFHSKWLSMMYPRLRLARNLLKEDGVIFVSIDDNEVHNLRAIMNEIFGEENFIAELVWKRRASSAMAEKNISIDHEYVITFQKGELESLKGSPKDFSKFKNPDNDPKGNYVLGDLTVGMSESLRPNQAYTLVDPTTGNEFFHNPDRVWAFIPTSMEKLIAEGRIYFPKDPSKRPMQKRFKNDLLNSSNPLSSFMLDVGLNTEGTKQIKELFGNRVFDYTKPISLIRKLIEQVMENGDILLDFFAGSNSSAQAVIECKKKDYYINFITVQLPELTDKSSQANKEGYERISDIAKDRIIKLIEMNSLEEGFKFFSLINSNYKKWNDVKSKDVSQLENILDLFNSSPLRDDWNKNKLLTELMLLEGFPLDSDQITLKMGSNEMVKVESEMVSNTLIICLDDVIEENIIDELEIDSSSTFICLDSAISNQNKLRLSDKGLIKTI